MPFINFHLVCPSKLEENILDMLMSYPHAEFYVSHPVRAHVQAEHEFSSEEKVLGHAGMLHIQILLESHSQESLLTNLRSQFTRTGCRYWTTPINEVGDL